MSKYTTGELAKLCNVSVRTVQYYDTRNILVPSELSEGGRRLYSEEDLKRMKIICFLRDAGISINDIGKVLSEENTESVISILLNQQEEALRIAEESVLRGAVSCYALEGFSLGKGLEIIQVGNRVKIVGSVQYWEGGGIYQISNLTYRIMKPNDPDNIQLISKGHAPSYTLTDPATFCEGKVTVTLFDEDGNDVEKTFSYAQLALNTTIEMHDLYVSRVYTTNNGGASDGAMTLTCTYKDPTTNKTYTIEVRTGVLYDANGNKVESVQDDCELTAKWIALEEMVFVVTFDLAGGQWAEGYELPATINGNFKPATPVRDGFKFLGWFDETGKQVEVITGDAALTAKWEEVKFTVTYNGNGGIVAKQTILDFGNEMVELFNSPTEADKVLTTYTGFQGSTHPNVKYVFDDAETLAKYKWFLEYTLAEMKATAEAAGKTGEEYYTNTVEMLEKMIAGDTKAISGSYANGRTAFRQFIHLLINKADPKYPEVHPCRSCPEGLQARRERWRFRKGTGPVREQPPDLQRAGISFLWG